MQEIQLYIQGEQVELFKDESVSITQSIQNVKDIAKVFTEFTKSFTVPASKKNNRIFKHYYNYDIVGGFDARQKVASTIELNYLPFKNGFIKLEGVDLKNNSPYAYRLTFFGATVNLKDLLGEDKLDALSWLDNFVVDYSAANIRQYLANGADITVNSTTYTDAIITPLISNNKRLYYDPTSPVAESGNLYYDASYPTQGVYFSDLKYSIRLHLIVLAIQEAYPEIQFSDDFFDSSNSLYYDLYMYMHRKKGDVQASATGLQLYTQLVDSFPINNDLISAGGEILNGTTLVIPPYKFGDCWEIRAATYSINTSTTDPYNAIYRRNGQIIFEAINITGNSSFNLPKDAYNKVLSGNYTVTLESSTTNSFNYVRLCFDFWEDACTPRPYPFTSCSSTPNVVINSVFKFYPTQQLPEMKIIDFLTGLFKTFNLTAYEQDGIIKVETLDSYYSSFNTYDISEFVDVNTSAVNVGLPYKEISFENKGNDTFFASVFNQLNNREYGQLDYKGEENLNWEGSIYKVELPFENVLYERLYNGSTPTTVQWGWMADDNQESYIGAPLIHYVHRIFYNEFPSPPTGISYRTSQTTNQLLYTYYIPLDSQNIFGTGQSLNFFAEIDSYSLNINTETLFNNFYLNYIKDVFNIKRRLTKLKAFLPLRILLNFNLSDRFDINGQRYKINSITTNLKTGESDIELLNEV